VAAAVSVIDASARTVLKHIPLPSGSTLLRGVCVSPDGRFAAVTHVLARFHLPTTQLERGWIMSSALSFIDVARMQLLNTVLLDNIDRGAANPWAVAWTADGRSICVTHAGTHELSVIDASALLAKLASLPTELDRGTNSTYAASSRTVADVPNDLAFLVGLRKRIPIPGNGPRALALAGPAVCIANYFSDSLCTVDLSKASAAPVCLPLHSPGAPSVVRKGEMFFNDATLCFQGWLSCASCHSSDARVDGLNWDLLNDGIGNPKDTKSLILSYQTPPVMSLGVRSTAEVAVRSGIQNSLGTALPEDVAAAMDEWIKSLQPAPSPHLVNGRLSDAARRGETLFKSPDTGCMNCHEPPLFTDLRSYNVGTYNAFDREDREFDTPTLRELWRTAPYLHDGSAATIRDVLTTSNPKDEHGKTSRLSARDIDDLAEYLLSL